MIIITKEDAVNIVKDIFNRVEKASSLQELKNILEDAILNKYKMNDKKYPKLNFGITKDELENFGDRIPQNLDLSKESTLTKLLYAIVWKNGDLGKEEHIIKGIKESNDTERIVFYQLGKHLTDRKQPIYDQHVLRAFQFYENIEIEKNKVIGDSVTKTQHGELADRYVQWITETAQTKHFECYTYWVDKILFALGKKIKKELSKEKS